MSYINVSIKGGLIRIDKDVFIGLLGNTPISERVGYTAILKNKRISFSDLKAYSRKTNIPYPLFFATKEILKIQISNSENKILVKLPSKKEIGLSSRGKVSLLGMNLILRDLSRKQEFLKNKVFDKQTILNKFVGNLHNSRKTIPEQASIITNYFDIKSTIVNKRNKTDTLAYLVRKIELKDIFVCFSSYNYMPQNISKDAGFSGICLKDKRFPFVFINRRDHDEKPLKWETEGRQIFTLILMIVCISKNRYVISSDIPDTKDKKYIEIYNLVEEILMPEHELKGIKITSIEDTKYKAIEFSVTPSALIMRLVKLNLISLFLSKKLWKALKSERSKIKKSQGRNNGTVDGYRKYNGDQFSVLILTVHRLGTINYSDTKNILFTNKKLKSGIFENYNNYYKIV